jgi:hypothetical protein
MYTYTDMTCCKERIEIGKGKEEKKRREEKRRKHRPHFPYKEPMTSPDLGYH